MARILHVINIPFVIPYFLGNQISFFISKGHSVFIACSPHEKLLVYQEKWKFNSLGVQIRRNISPIDDFFAVLKIRKYIIDNKIDTVIGHTPKGAFVGLIAGYLTPIKKRIYFRHGLMYETSSGLKRFILIAIERFTSYIATEVICVSSSVLSKSISANLSKKDKLSILNMGTCNGVDSISQFNKALLDKSVKSKLKTQLKIGSDNVVVGFIGRLAKDKGINELIQAWNEIILHNPKMLLLLVGPLDERDAIEEEAYFQIISCPQIRYIGQIENPEDYYALMDIFILPSYREGFPTVVLEASAMELPVITTKMTGCIDSILENETGIFTEINKVSIVHAVMKYVDNPTLRQKHGQRGRQFIEENFAQMKIWQEIERIVS